jgi:hypothetical protein
MEIVKEQNKISRFQLKSEKKSAKISVKERKKKSVKTKKKKKFLIF